MSNQIALPANVGEREGSQTQESEGDDDLSSSDEDGTICEAEGCQNIETESLDSESFVDRCFERNKSVLKEEYLKRSKDGPFKMKSSLPTLLPPSQSS